MTIPPLIELAHLAPGCWRWLINLAWVRHITRRPAPEEIGTPDVAFLDEKSGTMDEQSSFMDGVPLLDKTQRPDHPGKDTEDGKSKL